MRAKIPPQVSVPTGIQMKILKCTKQAPKAVLQERIPGRQVMTNTFLADTLTQRLLGELAK